MHRIDTATAAPGGLFTSGNPQTGVRPTVVSPEWLNAVQEAIARTIEGAGVALNKADDDQFTRVVLGSFGITPFRQSVVFGRLSGANQPEILATLTGLDFQILGQTTPVVLSFGAGVNSLGLADRYGLISSNITLTMPANVTRYVYADRNPSTGAITTGLATQQPVYGDTHPSSPTTGQHSFLIPLNAMYRWDGSAWVQVQRVFIGAVISGGSSITSITNYPFRVRPDVAPSSNLLGLVFSSQSDINANLSFGPATGAVVALDPDVTKRGLYYKVGASGSGSWTQVTDFVPGIQVVFGTDSGSGPANDFDVSTTLGVPATAGRAIVHFISTRTITGAARVRFDGGSWLNVKTISGQDPMAGTITANMLISGILAPGGIFRMTSDLASAAIQALCQDAAATAIAAQNAAQGFALQATAGIYTTTSAGITATTNGQYFYVPSAVAGQSLILYQNQSAVAVEIKRFADINAPGLNNMVNHEGPTEFALTDQSGLRWLRITPDLMQHPWTDTLRADATAAKKTTDQFLGDEGPTEFALADGLKNKFLIVRPNIIRHLHIDRLDRELAAALRGAPDPALSDFAVKAQRMGLCQSGQSNGMGYGGFASALIGSTALTTALMFNGGIRPDQANTANLNVLAGARASFVDAVESIVTSSYIGFANGGDTGLTAAARMIAQLLWEEDGVDFATTGQKFVLSADGQGGSGIAGMLPGAVNSDIYNRYSASMTAGKSISQGLGLSYAPIAMPFIIGETDTSNNVSQASFLASMQTVQSQAEAVARSVSPGRRFPLIVMQTCVHPTYVGAAPGVALAQLQACDDPRFVFAAPMYACEKFAAGNVHLTNLGYTQQGAYIGLATKRLVWDRIKVRPLVPIAQFTGNKIRISFPTLGRGRKLVTGAIPPMGTGVHSTWGITAVDAGGTAKTLSNPVQYGNEIVLDAAETPANAWSIRFGFVGDAYAGFTNIRDDDPAVYDRGGYNLSLFNWVPICQAVLATG